MAGVHFSKFGESQIEELITRAITNALAADREARQQENQRLSQIEVDGRHAALRRVLERNQILDQQNQRRNRGWFVNTCSGGV